MDRRHDRSTAAIADTARVARVSNIVSGTTKLSQTRESAKAGRFPVGQYNLSLYLPLTGEEVVEKAKLEAAAAARDAEAKMTLAADNLKKKQAAEEERAKKVARIAKLKAIRAKARQIADLDRAFRTCRGPCKKVKRKNSKWMECVCKKFFVCPPCNTSHSLVLKNHKKSMSPMKFGSNLTSQIGRKNPKSVSQGIKFAESLIN